MIRAALACALAALLLAAPARAAWEPVPLPPPPGGTFSVPFGFPGDLSFWAPNRGLVTVGGNAAVPEGLYSWDGEGWHQLSTVCGGGERARIAWAGPTEFWTIARPSLPRPQEAGFALCHFKDGEVVGSYSTAPDVADPFNEMTAAACRAPDDCWFGGFGGQDGTGTRIGAFHLHWDGSALETVYNPQGRAVSDLAVQGGTILESTYVGARPGNEGFDAAPAPPFLRDPEDPPALLHTLAAGTFANDPFAPTPPAPDFPAEGTELRALAVDGDTAWAVGGGANSGPFAPAARLPLAARRTAGTWTQLTLTAPGLGTSDVFSDVAAVPGTGTAWAAVTDVAEGEEGVATAASRVARIAADGTVTVETIDVSGSGAVRRVACPAANDCWAVTSLGYLFRNTTAGAYPRDTDPAFQGTITQRPNEAAGQFIPDDPPEDDSQLFAPPVELRPDPDETDGDLPPCRTLPSLVSRVKAKPRGRTRLVVSFRLARSARIGLVARKGRKVVARTKVARMKKGKRSLTLKVTPKRWPDKLKFTIKGDTRKRKPCSGGSGDGDGDVITSSVR